MRTDHHASDPPAALIEPLCFADLEDFAEDDHQAAFALFAEQAAANLHEDPVLRPAAHASEALRGIFRAALALDRIDQAGARKFFETHFTPHRVFSGAKNEKGFVTGYYEPLIEGSLVQTEKFSAPVYARPDDLVTLAAGEIVPGLPAGLAAARRLADGKLIAYPDRAAIAAGALEDHARPILYLTDSVEVFFAQVQGSARVVLQDGRQLRLTYAGRNGHPYTSIGRILVEAGEVPADKIGLESVKAWIRAKGQRPGEAGHALMAHNRSYVFFAVNADLPDASGPIGGAGLSLVPLRSIAIDRQIWPYGLPIWLSADLPWQSERASPFRRLCVAADTGSAIVGPARVDLFFGTGHDAGIRAGSIRHTCDFVALLPREPGGAA
jgi:membrane-bound lytic murein transglycosylase A